MERSVAAVLRPGGPVPVSGARRVRRMAEADEVHRVLDRLARAREEREQKHDRGESADPAHGADVSRRSPSGGPHGSDRIPPGAVPPR